MKRVIRSGERREFHSAASGAARSVADMFDSALAWFTPERRARILFPAEIALGAFFALALLLDQTWRGGFVASVLSYTIALLLGSGVALHRKAPGIAAAR